MKTLQPRILASITKPLQTNPPKGERRITKSGLVYTVIIAGDGYVLAQQAAIYPQVFSLRCWLGMEKYSSCKKLNA